MFLIGCKADMITNTEEKDEVRDKMEQFSAVNHFTGGFYVSSKNGKSSNSMCVDPNVNSVLL